jgi:hypothetical protein
MGLQQTDRRQVIRFRYKVAVLPTRTLVCAKTNVYAMTPPTFCRLTAAMDGSTCSRGDNGQHDSD